MRKLLLAYTTSLLMLPISGWTLGMGDVRVNSHLNQPLNAEIELHSVTRKDIESLRVTLAPKTVYLRADIERSQYLSKLIFKVIQRNGKNYVSVTTQKPFKVPFANFLVEASWGAGRLHREYTILLDPPDFIAKHARPVTTSQLSSKSLADINVPTNSRKNNSGASSDNSINKPDFVLIPKDNSTQISSVMTKQNDTLWHVAKKMAPAGISVEQMMMVLLHDNPDAFANNNINNLKTGYVLRIKDPNSLNKLSRTKANNQVKAQYESWNNARKQKPVENLVDRSIQQPEDIKTDGQLSLVATGKKNKSDTNNSTGTQVGVLKEKIIMVNEELNSKQAENQELISRINKLEELIKTKTSLIELKDKSLSILQKQLELKRAGNDKTDSTENKLTAEKLLKPTTPITKNESAITVKSSDLR